MRKKSRVIVLMGGKSPEHEVSLISGREVIRNLDKRKYLVVPVLVSRDGSMWKQLSIRTVLSLPDPLRLRGSKKEIVVYHKDDIVGERKILSKRDSIVFIAMHGPFGEDGTIQGLLELTGIKYTGSGVLASAIGMDKIMFKKMMISENIPVPKYISVRKGDSLSQVGKVLGNPPYFVKPFNQGSSIGASIVKNKDELRKGLEKAFVYSQTVLIEEYIRGREITCSVLGNERPMALPLIEIVPLKADFFDYESKYSESGAQEIVPAGIPLRLTRKIQKTAIRVYKAIGCRGFSRIDFLLNKDRHPVVLEVNTIPGLTPMSLLPKAAKAAGFSYSSLLDRIISYAFE